MSDKIEIKISGNIRLTVGYNDLVIDIKGLLSEKFKYRADEIELSFDDKVLKDGQTVVGLLYRAFLKGENFRLVLRKVRGNPNAPNQAGVLPPPPDRNPPVRNLNDLIINIIHDNKVERKEGDFKIRVEEDEKLANKFLEKPERFSLKDGEDLRPLRAYEAHIARLNDYFAMVQNTGGGQNDCLIISFLMGVSPAYIFAGEPGRNSIASFFRRIILPNMLLRSSDPNVLATLGGNTKALIDELTSTSYLSDIHITLLGHLFQTSILSLETGKVGQMTQLQMGQMVQVPMVEPPTVSLLPAINKDFKKQYDNGIIICNRGNGHYETVIDIKVKQGSVVFPLKVLVDLYGFIIQDYPFSSNRLEDGEHRGRLGGIEIKEGNFVKHDGQLFVVIDRKVNYPEKVTVPVTLRGAWLTPILNPPPKGWNEAFLLDSRGTSKLQDKYGTGYIERRGYQKLEEPGEPRRVKAVIFISAGAIEKIPEDKIPNILDADMAYREEQGIDTSNPGFVYLEPTLSKRRNADMEVYRSAVDGPAGVPGGEGAPPAEFEDGRGRVANAFERLRLRPPEPPRGAPLGATRRAPRGRLGNALLAGMAMPAPPEWTCPVCTLNNPMSAEVCGACGGPRPKSAINGNSPEGAAERERQLREGELPTNVEKRIKLMRDRRKMSPEERRKLWRCDECGLDNPITRSDCEACGTVRTVLLRPLPSPWRYEDIDKLIDEEEKAAAQRPLPPIRAPGQLPPLRPGAFRVTQAQERLAAAAGVPPAGKLPPLQLRREPPQPNEKQTLNQKLDALKERVAALAVRAGLPPRKGGTRRKRKTARRKKRNIVDKSSNVRTGTTTRSARIKKFTSTANGSNGTRSNTG